MCGTTNNPSVWVFVTMPTVHRFKLNAPEGPPELRENYGFGARELTMMARELTQQLQRLCAAWRTMHGED